MMKRIIGASAAIVLSVTSLVYPASAQTYDRAGLLSTWIPTCFPTNGAGLITAATMRGCMTSLVNSILGIYQDSIVAFQGITATSISTAALSINGVSYPGSLNIGSLVSATLSNIPTAVQAVVTNGYATAGDGGAGVYIRLSSAPISPRAWHFQSLDGAWWQLSTTTVLPKQMGAKLDGATDDTTAIQAWLDYPPIFGGVSVDQPGTAAIPTSVITLAPGFNVGGGNLLTIKRTTNESAALLECGTAISAPQNGGTIRGINLTTTAGFTGAVAANGSGAAASLTLSTAIANNNWTFTVPAGLGLTSGNTPFVQIAAVGSITNYMLATFVSYSGTSLVVNVISVVGTGTFSSFYIDDYPFNGPLADGNHAIRFRNCNNVSVENLNISGRFYNGIDARNSTNVSFNRNSVKGYVNRGIAAQAYLGFVMPIIKITNNTLDGYIAGTSTVFSSYGISTSATNGGASPASNNSGVIQQLDISGNFVSHTYAQGVVVGGQILYASVVNNNITLPNGASSIGVGVLIESSTEDTFQRVVQHAVVSNNIVFGGQQGLYNIGASFVDITGNNISFSVTGMSIYGDPAVAVSDYLNISSNNVSGCIGDGFLLLGAGAAGISYVSLSTNMSISNGGWGYNGSNESNVVGVGNVAFNNTSGSNNMASLTVPINGNILP